jgi:hypothetical protein
MMRIVRCNWKLDNGTYCAAQFMAKDRDEHRDYHMILQGITTFAVAGTHIYKVPKKVTKIKIQAWGGGGGSGHFKDRKGGSGGGGAFVEAILTVEPYDVLEIVVGSGGGPGVYGTDIEVLQTQKSRDKSRVEQGMIDDIQVQEGSSGISLGGEPGGGQGYGGGLCW